MPLRSSAAKQHIHYVCRFTRVDVPARVAKRRRDVYAAMLLYVVALIIVCFRCSTSLSVVLVTF